MRAAKDADADRIHIFLEGGVDDHFGGLAETCINDFDAGVPKRGGDDPGAAVMAVKADFGYEHADRALLPRAAGAARVGGRSFRHAMRLYEDKIMKALADSQHSQYVPDPPDRLFAAEEGGDHKHRRTELAA